MKTFVVLLFVIVAAGCGKTPEEWCPRLYNGWAHQQCCIVCDQGKESSSQSGGWTLKYYEDLTIGCFCTQGKAALLHPKVVSQEVE